MPELRDEPKRTPLPYPDHVKLLKRMGLSSVAYLVCGLSLLVIARVVLGSLGSHQWVAVTVSAAFALGFLAVMVWAGSSWQKEEHQRRRDLQAARAGAHPAPGVGTEPRLTVSGLVRTTDYTEAAAQLTRGERIFLRLWLIVIVLLPPCAGLLTIFGRGAVRAVGIALLLVALIIFAVPVSPLLKARIRRPGRD